MILYCSSWLLYCLLVLLSVAFFTLFERKVIRLFHNRVGPNKVSFLGLLQPLLDAFKLLSKQSITPLRSNKLIYNLSPQFSLFLSLYVWVTMPLIFFSLSSCYSFLIFFCLSSIMVFSVLLSGWSSNSKYSLIGRLRSVAQSVSYEAVIRTIIVIFCYISFRFSSFQFISMSSCLYFIVFPLWFICVLAETHRAPFDFRESESELVSGFNTEYSGAYFAFLFLAEYSILLFSSFLIVYIFFSSFLCLRPGSRMSFFLVCMSALFFSYLFIWVRVTFCRFRYDLLMIAAWKLMLPIALIFFIFFIFL